VVTAEVTTKNKIITYLNYDFILNKFYIFFSMSYYIFILMIFLYFP